jgi:transcriptional regulator with XRE-family HTH domain
VSHSETLIKSRTGHLFENLQHVVYDGTTPYDTLVPRYGWCTGEQEAGLPSSGSPTVRQRRIAAELRRLREESGKTAEAVADVLGWSKAKISRYELARSGLKPSDVEKLLDVYGVRGEHREQLLALAEEATQRGWWEAYSDILTEEHLAFIALEAEATTVLQWQINVVPGLLQTEDYARHVFLGYQSVRAKPPALIERRVQTRLIRQRVLSRDQPLKLAVIIDESVLRRQRGDHAVMYAQLHHLAEASRLPNVTLQVLPLDEPRGLALDSFIILHFGKAYDTQLHDVVSTESLTNYFYIEGETDTYEFRLAFEQLARESLAPDESRELILRTAQERWQLPADHANG